MRLQKKKKKNSCVQFLSAYLSVSALPSASRRLRNFFHGLRGSKPSSFLCSMLSQGCLI